jgi:hypothetical protein
MPGMVIILYKSNTNSIPCKDIFSMACSLHFGLSDDTHGTIPYLPRTSPSEQGFERAPFLFYHSLVFHGCTGNRILMRVPSPGTLSISIDPRWVSIILCTMAIPRPVPCFLVVK